MNINKIIVASNNRLETLEQLQHGEKFNTWVLGTTIATWLASTAASSVQPNGMAAMSLGMACFASATAYATLLIQENLRKKTVKNLENTIITEGNDQEKVKASELQAVEKSNAKKRVGYILGGIGVSIGSYYAIKYVTPELGVAWMKSALIFIGATASTTLSSKVIEKSEQASAERFSIAERIAKRNGVDMGVVQPTVSNAKFKL